MSILNAVSFQKKVDDDFLKPQPTGFVPALKQAVSQNFIQPTKDYVNRTRLAGQTLASAGLQGLGNLLNVPILKQASPDPSLIEKVQKSGMISPTGGIGKPELWKNVTNTTKTMANTLSLANPATALKYGTGGAIIRPAITTGVKLINERKLPTLTELKESSAQGLVTGVAYSGLNNLTKQLTDKAIMSFAPKSGITEKAISQAAPQIGDKAGTWIKKLTDVTARRLFRAGIEATIETPVWSIVTKEDKERYLDSLWREFRENLIVNSGGALVESAGDVKKVVGQTLNDIWNKHLEWSRTPEGIKSQTGAVKLPVQDPKKKARFDKEIYPEGSSFLIDEFRKLSGFSDKQIDKILKEGSMETDDYNIVRDDMFIFVTKKKPQSLVQKSDTATKSMVETKQTAKAESEIAKQIRSQYPEQSIRLITRAKKLFNSRRFQEGDIESLRKSWRGEVADKAIETVKEFNPAIQDEADAIDFILNFPTIKQTVTPRVKLSPEEIKLKVDALKEQARWDKKMGKPVTKTQAERMFKQADQQMWQETGAEPFAMKGVADDSPLGQSKALFNRDMNDTDDFLSRTFGARKISPKVIRYIPPEDITTIINNIDSIKNISKKSLTTGQTTRSLNNLTDNPQVADVIRRNLTDPLDKAGQDYMADIGSYAKIINDAFNNRGVTGGSKLSELVQRFGEAYGETIDTNPEAMAKLKTELGKDVGKLPDVVNAIKVSRQTYDQILDRLNDKLTSHGYDPIPKLPNYFTHIAKLTDKSGQLFPAFQALHVEMAGKHLATQPGRAFFSAALKRKGGEAEVVDALLGLEKYIKGSLRVIHTIEPIQKFRAFGQVLTDAVMLRSQADPNYKNTNLSALVEWMTDMANDLAGKMRGVYRLVENVVGRPEAQALKEIDKQVGKNLILYNVGTALKNAASLSTETRHPVAFAKAIGQTLSDILTGQDKTSISGVESGFLKGRFADNIKRGDWISVLQEIGSAPMEFSDYLTSRIVLHTEVNNLLSKGFSLEEAVAQASKSTAGIMGNRQIGQAPLILKDVPILTKFALEPMNLFGYYFKDLPKEYEGQVLNLVAAVSTILFSNYVFNAAFEYATGGGVLPDPVKVVKKSIDIWEDKTKEYQAKIAEVAYLIAKEIPILQNFVGGGRVPLLAGKPTASEVKTNPLAALIKLSTYFNPIGGSSQLTKLVQGGTDYARGYTITGDRQVKYPIEQNVGNLLRVPFGSYSFPEAQQYYDLGLKPLSGDDSTVFKHARELDKKTGGDIANKLYTEVQLERRADKAKGYINQLANKLEIILGDPLISDKDKKKMVDAFQKKVASMGDWQYKDFVKFAKKFGITLEPLEDTKDGEETNNTTGSVNVPLKSLGEALLPKKGGVRVRSAGKIRVPAIRKAKGIRIPTTTKRKSVGGKLRVGVLSKPPLVRIASPTNRTPPKINVRRPTIRGLSVR